MEDEDSIMLLEECPTSDEDEDNDKPNPSSPPLANPHTGDPAERQRQNELDLLALAEALQKPKESWVLCFYCMRVGHRGGDCDDKKRKERTIVKDPIWMDGWRQRKLLHRDMDPNYPERRRLQHQKDNQKKYEKRLAKRMQREKEANEQQSKVKLGQCSGGAFKNRKIKQLVVERNGAKKQLEETDVKYLMELKLKQERLQNLYKDVVTKPVNNNGSNSEIVSRKKLDVAGELLKMVEELLGNT